MLVTSGIASFAADARRISGNAAWQKIEFRIEGAGFGAVETRFAVDDDTVVATIMSNSGFINSLAAEGIKCVQTDVGDRFVYESMQNNDYSLGGEQSGHIILKKYATTGDGLLTAIMVTDEVCDSKSTLSELAKPVKLYPQITKNVRVKSKEAVFEDEAILEEKKAVEELINGKGRVLLRKSGTEPVVRVMVESEENCEEYVNRLVNFIIERGHSVE